MKNRKLILDAPYYMFVRKHTCPHCTTVMTTKKVSKTINSKSEEAKDFDFSHAEISLHGDVEFTWFVFHCEKCNIDISRKEMKKYETNYGER